MIERRYLNYLNNIASNLFSVNTDNTSKNLRERELKVCTLARSFKSRRTQVCINHQHWSRTYIALELPNPIRCEKLFLCQDQPICKQLGSLSNELFISLQLYLIQLNPSKATHNRFHTCNTCCQLSITIKYVTHNRCLDILVLSNAYIKTNIM